MELKNLKKKNLPYEDAIFDSPIEKGFELKNLNHKARQSVRKEAANLVYGHYEGPFKAESKWVLDWLLNSIDWSLFFAPDLIVPNGCMSTFADYSTTYFNNVIVEGSGTIRLGANTKLHAYQIKHI